MPKIILFDDTLTSFGSAVNTCQSCLGKHGFDCIADDCVNPATMALFPSVIEIGDYVKKRVIEEEAEGIVMDLHWGEGVSYNGFDIVNSAIAAGVQIDSKSIVFLTQHEPLHKLPGLARKHGFQEQQVQFKNAQGNESVVRWFCTHFGKSYKGCHHV